MSTLLRSKSVAVSVTFLCLVTLANSAPQQKGKGGKTPAKAAEAPRYGNADSISQDELRNYLYVLASDQMEGRNLPSRGFDAAALYVASHLADWGLKPGGSTTGTTGPHQPYFMPMELVVKTAVAAESKATVSGVPGGGGRGGRGGGRGPAAAGAETPATPPPTRTLTLEYGKDWTSNAGGRGAQPLEPFEVSGNLAFVGNGYTVVKGNVDPYADLDVKGKIVVVAGLPAEIAAQQAAAAAAPGGGGRGGPNPLGEPCKDFMTPEQAAAKNGAVAVVTLATFQEMATAANPNVAGGGFGAFGGGGGGRGPAGLNGPNYRAAKLVNAPLCPVVPNVTAQLGLMSALFQGEKSTAQQIFSNAGLNTKQDSFALTPAKKLALKLVTKSESAHGENVIGMLEGSDPVLKNEYIVMSAHLDHIGLAAPLPDGHNVNNGADDDGSGSAALMAVARAYSEGAAKGIRPRRSIIFLWMAGEEKGLWGSQLFTQFPFLDLKKVVANINMDMIGRTKGEGFTDPDPTHVLVKPGEVLIVGPQISSSDLGKTIETVNASYQKMELNHFYDATAPDATHDNLGPAPNGQRIFYRSDHYNFAKMGIPIAFFTTGLHPDYHRATDTPDKIDYQEMQAIAKTVAALGWQLGTQDQRPEVNSKLPEQLMKDMKLAQDQGWGKIAPVPPPLPGMPK